MQSLRDRGMCSTCPQPVLDLVSTWPLPVGSADPLRIAFELRESAQESPSFLAWKAARIARQLRRNSVCGEPPTMRVGLLLGLLWGFLGLLRAALGLFWGSVRLPLLDSLPSLEAVEALAQAHRAMLGVRGLPHLHLAAPAGRTTVHEPLDCHRTRFLLRLFRCWGLRWRWRWVDPGTRASASERPVGHGPKPLRAGLPNALRDAGMWSRMLLPAPALAPALATSCAFTWWIPSMSAATRA